MNEERYYIRNRQAIQSMIDYRWSPTGIFTDPNAEQHPKWLLPIEAKILNEIAYIPSQSIVAWCVRFFSGPEGEEMFKSLLR
jgi:hypothetical protein